MSYFPANIEGKPIVTIKSLNMQLKAANMQIKEGIFCNCDGRSVTIRAFWGGALMNVSRLFLRPRDARRGVSSAYLSARRS
jgi:hypothetical protein